MGKSALACCIAEHVGITLKQGVAIFSLEMSKDSDDQARVGMGAEFGLPEEYLEFGALTFRVGYFTADNLGQSFSSTLKNLNLDRTSGLSLGFGVFTSRAFGYGLAVDYAFVPYGALGTAEQFEVKLKF